jgi:hypothetical protein
MHRQLLNWAERSATQAVGAARATLNGREGPQTDIRSAVGGDSIFGMQQLHLTTVIDKAEDMREMARPKAEYQFTKGSSKPLCWV